MLTQTPVTITQADALAALSDHDPATLDAVVTDPPYCAGGFTEAARQGSKGMTKSHIKAGDWFDGDAMTTVGLSCLLREVARLSVRALRPGGSLLVFCDWRLIPAIAPMMESAGLRWRGLLVWDKLSQGQGARGFRARHELILWYLKNAPPPQGLKTTGNVIPCKRVPSHKRLHPTEKPVELLRTLIETVAPKGGVVADPFAGSGALGAAAIATGRRAFLSDADPRWVEVMKERFQDGLTGSI